MILSTLLSHQFKEWLRKPYWGLSLVAKLFSLFGLLLMVSSAFFVSWILPNMLQEINLPYPLLSIFMLGCLIYLCFDLSFRLFTLKLPGLNLLQYRLLNIPSKKLRAYVLFLNKLNGFNLIALFLIPPALFKMAGSAQAFALLSVLLLLLAINNYLFLLIKKSFSYNNAYLLVYALPVGLSITGFVYFGWILEKIELASLLTHPALIIILLGAVISLHFLCTRMLKKHAYVEEVRSKKEKAYGALKWLGTGPIANVLRLDILLILRNKRTRSLMILSLPLILLFTYQANVLSTEHSFFNIRFVDVLMGYILISAGSLNYSQVLYSWDSSYFDFILCAPEFKQRYLLSKFWLLAAMHVLFGLLASLAFVLIGKNMFLPFFLSLILFNVGFFSHLHLLGATLNNRYLDLSKSQMMNYQGTSGSMYFLPLLYFSFPSALFGLFYLLGVADYTGFIFGGIGLIGLILHKHIIRAIAKILDARKYEMAQGFRKRT